MITNETAQKLEKELRYGDKRRIANNAGFSTLTVIRFFNGKINELTSETQDKIFTESLNLVAERQKRGKALDNMANILTGQIPAQ